MSLARYAVQHRRMSTTMTTSAVAGALEDPACVVVDVRAMAAFNGWTLHGEARGGHLPGAVAFPLEWTTMVHGTALRRLLASKGIMPHRTIVVYDGLPDRSVAMARGLRRLGYPRVLTYDAEVAAWAAETCRPLARLPHYTQLVHPAWVDQLVRGASPATYSGHGGVVFEVGWANAAAYQAGHIPGARYLALEAYEQPPVWTHVSDTALEARLRVAGIRYDTTVVLYGRDTTAVARAAVLLMYAGVDDVRVLDGGMRAWCAAGYPLVTTTPCPAPERDFGAPLPGIRSICSRPQTCTPSSQSATPCSSVCGVGPSSGGPPVGILISNRQDGLRAMSGGMQAPPPAAWTIIATSIIPCATIRTLRLSGTPGESPRTNALRFIVGRAGGPVRRSSMPR